MNNDIKRIQKELTEEKKKNTLADLIFSNFNNFELLKFAGNSIFLTFQGALECNIW